MKYRALLIFALLFSTYNFTVYSQENQVDLLVDDLLKIAQDFATPAATGAAYQAGAGWFHSAKNLDVWQVDISVHGNALFVPSSQKTTQISSADYTTFSIEGAENAEIPTAFGKHSDVRFKGGIDFMGKPIRFGFQALEGINKKVVVHPFVQASLGLPYGTELTLRVLPQVNVEDVQFGTYGIGLKHNFNQYFRNSQPNNFQFAALVAYSKFNVDYEFRPVVIEEVAEMDGIKVGANLWLVELIASKGFYESNWEVFGAVGATNSSFAYTLGGGGAALGEINNALGALDQNKMQLKADLGLSYSLDHFTLSSMFSIGKFYNLNLGLHYKL